MYRLIVSDYDGTMVGKDRVVPKKLKDAIRLWFNAGREFVIATGNQYATMAQVFSELNLRSPQIVRGGTEIVEPSTGELLWHEYIPANTTAVVVQLLQDHNIPFHTERDTTIYTWNGERLWYPDVLYADIGSMPSTPTPKIVLLADIAPSTEAIDEFVATVLQPTFPELTFLKSHTPLSTTWDITSHKASKQHALTKLQAMLTISPEETVAIGDSYNDAPLLKKAGLRVVVSNAPSELQVTANIVAPSYEEAGVAIVIHSLLTQTQTQSDATTL